MSITSLVEVSITEIPSSTFAYSKGMDLTMADEVESKISI